MPTSGHTSRPRTSWSTQCEGGTQPGRGSESTCATFPSRSDRPRKRSRSTTIPGPATRVPTAPVSWSARNAGDLLPATLDLDVLFRALVDQLPLWALLDLQQHVGLDLDRAQLPLQLAVTGKATRIERPVLQRRNDSTIGFALMPAIGKPAAECQLLDVEENLSKGFRPGPQLDLPQARCVDDEAAAGHLQELAMTGRVAPLATFVHIGRPQHLLAEQAIDQGGFADAGRSHQHRGLSPGQIEADGLDPGAGHAADGDHRHTGRDRLQFHLERVRVV